MIIEKMKIEDYSEVYKLWLNTPGMGLNTIDDSKEGIKRYLKRNPKTCFVALENERIIGVILCGHDGRRGNIHHAAVATDFKHRGIGRNLVDHAVKGLQEENIYKVSFVVFTKNKAGNRFWDKLGFKERTDLVFRDKLISAIDMKRIDT
jgi:N-acetylglutamate synthase